MITLERDTRGRYVAVPPCGIHESIEFSDYLRWPAASNSRLSALLRSPAHLAAALQSPAPEPRHLAIGRATHAAILEPDRFAVDYVRGPAGDRRTKAARELWAHLEAEHGAGFVLRPDEYDAALAMAASVWRKKSAATLLTGEGGRELSALWVDPATDVRSKARFDRYRVDLDGGVIADIKTTVDAGRASFERSIFKFGYHRQGGMYLEGARELGAEVAHFAIIAVEKSPPFESIVYRLTDEAVAAGRAETRPLLETYRGLAGSPPRDWPGYPDTIIDVGLPRWAWGLSRSIATGE